MPSSPLVAEDEVRSALRPCGLARTQFVNRVSRKFSDMPSILYLAPCAPGKTFGQASRVAQIVGGLEAIGKVDLVVVKAAEWLMEIPPGLRIDQFATRYGAFAVWRSFRSAFRCPLHGCDWGDTRQESDRASIMDMLWRLPISFWIHSLRVADALQRWQWPRSVMDIDNVENAWIQTELESGLSMAGRFRTWVRWHAARRRERLFGDRFTTISVCSDVDREYLFPSKEGPCDSERVRETGTCAATPGCASTTDRLHRRLGIQSQCRRSALVCRTRLAANQTADSRRAVPSNRDARQGRPNQPRPGHRYPGLRR